MCEKTNFHHPHPPKTRRGTSFFPPSGCPFPGVALPKSVIRWGGQPGRLDPKGRRWPRTPPLQSASRPPRQRERERAPKTPIHYSHRGSHPRDRKRRGLTEISKRTKSKQRERERGRHYSRSSRVLRSSPPNRETEFFQSCGPLDQSALEGSHLLVGFVWTGLEQGPVRVPFFPPCIVGSVWWIVRRPLR